MADHDRISRRRYDVQPGDRFGRLTVVRLCGIKNKRLCAECLCECGTALERNIYSLSNGPNPSCGCAVSVHGHSGGRGIKPTAEYTTWQQMKDRCFNAHSSAYKYYGGRGIRVCDEWQVSYERFLRDVGPKPSACSSLDRIDYNGHYEPTNVRWATPIQQGRNRRSNRVVGAFGVARTISEWCEKTGLNHTTLTARLDNGWEPETAITTPLMKQFSHHRQAHVNQQALGDGL